MGYTAVVSRQIGDTEKGFEWAAVDESGAIVEEIWDNGIGAPFSATQLEIKEQSKYDRWYASTHLEKIHLDVYVTDSRVIIRCDKYDKGDSTWIGGLSALAMNGIERAVGAVRSRGKTLIGHIRYEWINEIYYYQKDGFLTDNTLRLTYLDNEKKPKIVELKLKKDTDMAYLANMILHKAARYRMSMTDQKKENLIQFLSEYSDENSRIPVSTGKREMSGVQFPHIYFAPFGAEFRPLSGDMSPINNAAEQIEEDVTIRTQITEEEKPPIKCTLTDMRSGEEIIIDGDTFTLGRSSGKCNYIISDPAVSNTHAQIMKIDNDFFVKDLGSSNYTFVNGVQTEIGNRLLKDGDVIKLARVEFKVTIN